MRVIVMDAAGVSLKEVLPQEECSTEATSTLPKFMYGVAFRRVELPD